MRCLVFQNFRKKYEKKDNEQGKSTGQIVATGMSRLSWARWPCMTKIACTRERGKGKETS